MIIIHCSNNTNTNFNSNTLTGFEFNLSVNQDPISAYKLVQNNIQIMLLQMKVL